MIHISNKIDIYYFNVKDFDIHITKNVKFHKHVSSFTVDKVKELAKIKWGFVEDAQIGKNALGKPFFINYPSCYFNISHSGEHIVIAIADSTVGVDIEIIDKYDSKIRERFFSKEEQKYVLDAEDNKVVISRFFKIWTMKEAYVKYTGEGLKRSFKSFDVMESNLKKRFNCFQWNGCYISVCTGESNEKIVKHLK